MNRVMGSALLRLMALICGLSAVSALADSQARIVRLSDVQGSVQIDQAAGQGYERAFLNLPIHQGMKLKTTTDSRAEVEFEDGSLIHLTPNTVLQFTDLSLRDSGGKLSTVDVQQGQAYFNFCGNKDDEFTVTFGQEKAKLTGSAHFRVSLKDTSTSLAVFNGVVQVEGPAGEVEIAKKQTATFEFAQNGQFELARNIEKDPSDAWDAQQTEYHERYLVTNPQTGYPYTYGVSDLNYYGNFLNLAGYGSCWQPYFIGLGWDPFLDGAWMWDPNFGYWWVSGYPWGWMPYHYGSWMYAGGGTGWCWLPGDTWVNYYVPVFRPPLFRPPRFGPHRPPLGSGHVVPVGRGPTSSTLLAKNGPPSIVVRPGDAGLSIPRGVRNLKGINREFVQHGQVTLRVSEPRSSGGNVAAMPRVSLAGPPASSMGHVGSASTMSAHASMPAAPAPSQTSSAPHK
jgi:hypothetical protein